MEATGQLADLLKSTGTNPKVSINVPACTS
jgi:hypothetical protein